MQITRLESNWGTPKDRSPGQLVAMTREWFAQLERFGVRTVEAAFTHVIGTSKFGWAGAGPIADLVAYCAKDHREWSEIVALGARDLPRIAPPTFERDGRTTAEEIAHRIATVRSMRKEAGLKTTAELEAEATPAESAPASQSTEMSFQLRHSCLARRARKAQTCSESCFKSWCELREQIANSMEVQT